MRWSIAIWLSIWLAIASGCIDRVTPRPATSKSQISLRFKCTWLGATVLDGWLVVDEDSLQGRDPEYYSGEIQCDDGGLIMARCTDDDTPGLVCKIAETQ